MYKKVQLDEDLEEYLAGVHGIVHQQEIDNMSEGSWASIMVDYSRFKKKQFNDLVENIILERNAEKGLA